MVQFERHKTERRIPGWAAAVLARLARERPPVLTRRDIATLLDQTDTVREIDRTVSELQRLGWIIPTHLKGVWGYLPPGEDTITDPYLDLRAWRARESDAVFALAGDAAAWHLGYLDRAVEGAIPIWLPEGQRPPHGLRSRVAVISLEWDAEDAPRVGPTPRLLHRRHLDLTRWASGLPAFGPEALVVQLSKRPSSFRSWADLVGHLEQLASDCDPTVVRDLLRAQTTSTWQHAAYLLARGSASEAANAVFDQRPAKSLPSVQFGSGDETVWDSQFHVSDHLIAPLQKQIGKA